MKERIRERKTAGKTEKDSKIGKELWNGRNYLKGRVREHIDEKRRKEVDRLDKNRQR